MNIEILKLDEPNRNGLTYTTECVQEALDKYGDKIMFGQLGLPEDGTVDLNRVSHQVTNMRIEDGKFVGTLKILDTPHGKILRQLLEGEARMDFRPHGFASIGSDGAIKDYEIVSIDLVSDGA